MATFSSFHCFPVDRDYKMIYTEANFKIDTVISSPETGRLQKGNVLDVGLPGGALVKPDGEKASFLRDGDSIFELNHKYLMLVRENAKAAGEYSVEKWWDITSGYVTPDTPEDKSLAIEGRSVLAGLSVSAALDYLRKVLPDVVEVQ